MSALLVPFSVNFTRAEVPLRLNCLRILYRHEPLALEADFQYGNFEMYMANTTQGTALQC